MEKETTLPKDLSIQLQLNWGTEDQARALGNTLMDCLREVGKYIDISDLAGVTVASDYDEGLATIDRGKEGLSPLGYTKNDIAEGCAKTVLVYRESNLKSYIIFKDIVVYSLLDKNERDIANTIYTVAHECAHVEFHSFFEHKIPGFLLKYAYVTHEEKFLMQFSESILMEYYACRISATFGKDDITNIAHNLVTDSLKDTLLKNKKAILSYRFHRNIPQLLVETGESILFPMQCIARLIGHLDGLDSEYDVFTYIDNSPEKNFLGKYISEMQNCLRALWDSQDSWENISIFEPLNIIGKQLLHDAGIQFTSLPDGNLWVSVP